MKYNLWKISRSVSRIRRRFYIDKNGVGDWIFKITLVLTAFIAGLALYHRTINMWALKNLGDSFLRKSIGSRMIVLGAFHREKSEQNVRGNYAVIHFLADGRQVHNLFCFSERDGETVASRALIQRIHQGKRAANDICSWSGHLAECEIYEEEPLSFRIGNVKDIAQAMTVEPEKPLNLERQPLVVCVAPMYIYTDWEIMVTGIETWLALGATKIIVPIQSASTTTYRILKAYEEKGFVVIRHWPKWPVLSDSNPNGLVLSRGIEESHVNCLFYVKPFADMVVFTDIDDMLLPVQPMDVHPRGNIGLLQKLFDEHPQAGSLLFEHREVQFKLPEEEKIQSVDTFNFNFLENSKSKQNCEVWRMKTRVVVKAARVDSVNMHETGIHRFGYVQTRVPCRQGHFYHLRHSHRQVPDAIPISLDRLRGMLNSQWESRIEDVFESFRGVPLNKSSTESFEDFDHCMSAINSEHWTLSVSRCLTPHVCFSRLQRDVDCVASTTDYWFNRSGSGYLIASNSSRFVKSEENCETPTPRFTAGNHFFAP